MGDRAPARKPETVRVAARHIQETRGRARQFWRAFDHSPVPMVTVDAGKRYQAANVPARLVFRLSLEEWRRRRIEDLTPPHMMATLHERWARLMRQGAVAGRYDCDLPDGSHATIVYCALANVLPGEHLIVFLPAGFQDDELEAMVDGDERPARGPLTRREQEVLTLIATGAGSDQIADELSISIQTVRTHTRNLLHRLGARNRPHAIALAIQQNLIDVSELGPGGSPSPE